jgi:hypothetical protein
VVTSQTAIGWQHFLFGRLSKEWSTAQRLHITAADQDADKYSASYCICVDNCVNANLIASGNKLSNNVS